MLILNVVHSYEILGIFPLTGKSHFLSFEPILKGLAVKGHKVTVLGYFPLKQKLNNYNDIVIGDANFFTKGMSNSSLTNLQQLIPNSREVMYTTFLFLASIGQSSCEMMFNSAKMQQFMKRDDRFDIVISEYFNSDCALVVAKKFNCPVIRVHSATLMPWTGSRFGNPLNPAYIPINFLPFSDRMDFFERLENTIVTCVQNIYFNYFLLSKSNDLIERRFGKSYRTLDSEIYQNSLLLVNSYFALNLPRPFVPNVIEIGGAHIDKSQPLSVVS